MKKTEKVRKVISVTNSCETREQLRSTVNWYNNMPKLQEPKILISIKEKMDEIDDKEKYNKRLSNINSNKL